MIKHRPATIEEFERAAEISNSPELQKSLGISEVHPNASFGITPILCEKVPRKFKRRIKKAVKKYGVEGIDL